MSFIDDLLHPTRKDEDSDPGRPFTPPPSTPADDDEDDEGGPNFPMDPALA